MSIATSTSSAPTSLRTEKVSVLLKQFAIPAIIAMAASSLYNTIDSIYLGHGVGPLALSALGVCFPLMNLSTALGTLSGVGGATIISILLGQKKYSQANNVLGNLVGLNIITGGLFAIVGLIWIDPILRFFGASDITLPYARDYFEIILYGNIITHLYFGLNAAMRSSGNPRFAMNLTLFTVIFNAILDPIFIFVLSMGVRGVAIATVISQFCAFVIILYAFCQKKRVLHFEGYIIKFQWPIVKQSLLIGISPFLMNSAACMVNLMVNQQLLKYVGDHGIGAYSIIFRLNFLLFVTVLGLNHGMQPIAGYNYGAKLYSRVKEVYLLTVKLALCITGTGFLLCMCFPKFLCMMFTSDPDMLELSTMGLRYVNMALPLVGFGMVSTSLFQNLGLVRKSIFLSLCRQLLLLVPLIYILPKFFGTIGLWLSFPISDFISVIIAFVMILKLFKHFNSFKDGNGPDALQNLDEKTA